MNARLETIVMLDFIGSGEASDSDLDEVAFDTSHTRAVRVAARRELARRTGEAMTPAAAWASIVAGRAAFRERFAKRQATRAKEQTHLNQIRQDIRHKFGIAMTGEWEAAVDAFYRFRQLCFEEQRIEVGLGERKRITAAAVPDRTAAARALRTERKLRIAEYEQELQRQRERTRRDERKAVPPKRKRRSLPLRPADPPEM